MSGEQSISKQVRNLVRDRLNYMIDDNQFKQKLLGILGKSSSQNVSLALASADPNYLYLLTDKVAREIASWVPFDESDWKIAMRKWGRGKLRGDVAIKNMLDDCLRSSMNKTAFEQRLKKWIHEHEGQPDFMKYLREELVGALLDHLFALADEVNPEIRQRFKKFASIMTE